VGLVRWPLACAVLLCGTAALANPVEVFGFGSRRAGQANVGVAGADDAAALYYDPAGLVATPGGELVAGTLVAYSHLSINTLRADLADSAGFQLAARAPLPLGGVLRDRFTVGLALHVLRYVARIIAPPADEPFYPYYGDRLSRLVVLPGAAARLGHGISLGVAANVLAGFGSRAAGERDAAVPSVARLIAGAQWQIDPALRVGLVYRQRFEVPFVTTTQLRVTGQFTPHQLAAGVQWTSDAFAAGLDLGLAKWSGYPGPFVRAGEVPRVPFDNTFGVRAGLESVTGEGFVYRGGYAFESSPVPKNQTGVTNLLDGHKHTIAGGMGYVLKQVRIDVHAQVQLVSTRTSAKTVFDGVGEHDPYTSLPDEDTTAAGVQITNLGYPSLKSGGEVFSGGITATLPL
jgi:hypothetical protein